MDREPPKGLKWPAEGLHYTWGSTRGSAHTQVPQDQPAIPSGVGIDPRLSVVSLGVQVSSKEDSCHQVILEFHCPSSLDYRVHHELPSLNVIFLNHFLKVALTEF